MRIFKRAEMSGSSTLLGDEASKYKIATNNTFIIETNNHYHDGSPYSSNQQKLAAMTAYPENGTKKNGAHVSFIFDFLWNFSSSEFLNIVWIWRWHSGSPISRNFWRGDKLGIFYQNKMTEGATKNLFHMVKF